MNVWEQHKCASQLQLLRVRIAARRSVSIPKIPSGIMAEFCHRMFHKPLGLVGIQSSQSFFIWGSQLLSINCTPNGAVGSKAPGSVVLGKENCCSSQKKRSWKTRPLTSKRSHWWIITPRAGSLTTAEEWKMTSQHFSSIYRRIRAAPQSVSPVLDREQSGQITYLWKSEIPAMRRGQFGIRGAERCLSAVLD